jgi:REP element-mobilizing transposase RayT
MDDNPFALLITWTCYGTWLPGDERGFVSNQRLAGGGVVKKINFPTVPPLRDDSYSRACAINLQKYETVRLDLSQANLVARSLITASHSRSWRILRASIMANHCHIVVVDCPDDGPTVRRVLKGITQRDLSRTASKARRWWTAGGSDRYLHGHESIGNAVNYVQGQKFKLAEIDDMQVIDCV